MPKMDGLEIIKTIKLEYPEVFLIMMTALAA
ncbi:hypothetical protein [Candidatus Kuenenia stuttgartiensis]